MGSGENKVEELLKMLQGLEANLEETRRFLRELSQAVLAKPDQEKGIQKGFAEGGSGARKELEELLAKTKAHEEALEKIERRVTELEKGLKGKVDQRSEALLASPTAGEAGGLEASELESEAFVGSAQREASTKFDSKEGSYGVETLPYGDGGLEVRFYRTADGGLILDGTGFVDLLAACLDERERLISEIKAAKGQMAERDIIKKLMEDVKKLRIDLVKLTDALKGDGLAGLATMFGAKGASFEEATISVLNQEIVGEINSALRSKPGDAPYKEIEDFVARYKAKRRMLGESYWSSPARQLKGAPPEKSPIEAPLDLFHSEEPSERRPTRAGSGAAQTQPSEKSPSLSAKAQRKSGPERREESLDIGLDLEKIFEELKVG